MISLYYLYENTPTNKVTLHNASCKFCNGGKGIHPEAQKEINGTWHGPFTEYNLAKMFAKDSLANHNYKDCKKCNPENFEYIKGE